MPAQRNNRNGRKSEVTFHPYSRPTNNNDVAEPKALGDRKPLEMFFSQYPEFHYQPWSSSITEFRRLCEEYGWKKEDPEKEVACYEFDLAMKKEFAEPVALGDRKPLEIFFSQYPEFRYHPGRSSVPEFRRLCEEYGWEKEDPEKDVARYEFNLAMKKEFDSLYGSDEKDINNWYKLCYVLSIDPVPTTLKECRAAVFKKHVNLVDLVEGSREDIRIFESEKELSEYTRATGKFFPKENAADGGVLRALRRHILAPRDSRRISRTFKDEPA